MTAVFLLAGYPDLPGLLADLGAAGVRQVVAAVRDADLAWTVLRPSGFMANTLRWADQLAAGDVVREPFADVPVASIDPADIAAVAALVLTTEGHHGHSYRLTGPEALLPADRARILGDVLGRDLRVEPQPDDEARAQMRQDMPEPLAEAFFRFFRGGEYDDSVVGTVTPTLLGRPARTFRDWALAHADAFRHPPA